MFARRARRRLELATRTTESPKPSGGGRAKGKRNPGPAAAKKRGAGEDADEDEAGVEDGAGGKKPKIYALSESDDDEWLAHVMRGGDARSGAEAKFQLKWWRKTTDASIERGAFAARFRVATQSD
jgi:hypothetical protein